jgi:tetratricopeptide (TPR) repeat protein
MKNMGRALLLAGLMATVLLTPTVRAQTGSSPDQAKAQQAREALQAGDHATAIRLYGELVETNADDLSFRFGLGQALYFAGQVDSAIEHLERVRDASGGPGAVQYVLGQAYLEKERFDAASAALDAAAAERPDIVPLAFLRAELCYRIGRSEVAERRLRQVIAMQPDWDVPHLRLGALLLDEGRAAEAVGPLEQALQLQPANVDAALLLAGAYTNQERPEASVAMLESTHEALPDSLPILLALSFTYDKLSRAELLDAMANRILELAPGHPGAELRLAQQAELRGELEVALGHIRRADAGYGRAPRLMAGTSAGAEWDVRSGEAPEALRLMADLRQQLGADTEARRIAERLVAEYPRYPNGYFLLGNMMLRGGEAEAGREYLARFKQLTDGRVQTGLGANFLESDESLVQATAAFERAIAIDAKDARALIGLAETQRRSERPNEALEALERARTMGAEPVSWYTNYILALGAAGRTDAAMSAWAEATQLDLQLPYDVTVFAYGAVDACRF